MENFDSQLDAYKMDNEDYTPTLYTEIGKDQFSINSMPSFTGKSIIPVKLRAAFNGIYTLNASGIESFTTSDSIIFEDRLLGIRQNLRTQPLYTCNLTQGDTSSRFFINFIKGNNESPNLGTSSNPAVVIKGVEDKINFQFINDNSTRASIGIYNTLGEQIFKIENADISSKEYSIRPSYGSNGIYIVKVVTDAQTCSRKIYLLK
jgi:hypothetical protein